MWHAAGHAVVAGEAGTVLAHRTRTLVLGAQRVQLVEDSIELVLQAGDSLVESAVTMRRTCNWRVGRPELRATRTESTAETAATATCAKAFPATAPSAEAALRPARWWTIIGSAGF